MTLGFWTLRRKLIVLLLLASTLPLAVTTFLVYAQGRDLLADNARLRLATVGDAVTAQLDALNERYFALLGGLGRLPAMRAACAALGAGQEPEPYATEVMTAFAESDVAIRGIGMLDRGGTVRVSNLPSYLGANLAKREYYTAAQGRQTPTVELVVATRHAQPVPSLGYAQAFGDGACTIALGVDAGGLTEKIRGYNGAVGEGSYVLVVDRYGVRIAHSLRDDFAYVPTGPLSREERDSMVAAQRFGEPTATLLDNPLAAPEQYERARAGTLIDLGEAYQSWAAGNRQTNLTVARRLTSTHWTVFVMVPTRSIDEPVAALLRRIAPIGFAIVIAAFAIGMALIQRVVAPLRRLTAATAALAAGKDDVRLTLTTRDELATLGHAFNEMAGAISKATDQLEYKIADRTQALTAKNELLKRHREELLAHRSELVAQKEELQAQRDELERKNAEVERADRMKSEFLANMSHELRTPLNSVIGFADLLQVTAESRLQPDEQHHLRDIVAAGRHLLLIINDILDLAKIEAGHVRLELDAVDPEEVVAGASAMVASQARAKQIEIRAAIHGKRAVRADGDRLRQILLNLLSNAVKFSPEGAAIDVRVGDRDDCVVFEVIDRGPGIPAELAAQLFQPFVQGEGSLVKKHQGTGLGLAICKRLVELHGGTIELDTRVGEGTTFRVLLPAAGRRKQDSDRTGAPAVMLVVAGASNRPHQTRLEAAGYRVESAAPGADLAAEATRLGAAVIVIDVHDAGGDATEILARAGQLSTTIPVILLGHDTQVMVPKPIDAEPLRQLCRRLVGADGDKARVLVIDDDPRVAGLVAASLGPGYTVEAAPTATDGLRRARGERFDLHVVDLTLPDGSGFDILETLAGEEATRAIPRVVLTAAQLDKAQLEQLRRHAQAVAPKGSVTPEELLGVVDRLVRPPAAAPANDARPTVLVVDDHDMNRDLARSILERLGYGVVQARDGAEAVAVAERVVPALILMDLAMPGTDGFTATRQLKANPKLRRIPVVALSALAMKADEDKARAAGVDAYLTKPVDRLSLERTVARLLAD